MTLLSLNDLPNPRDWPSTLGLNVPLDDLLITAAILGIAVAVAVLLHTLAFGLLRRANAHGHLGYGEPVFDAVRGPSRWLAVAIAISAVAERWPLIQPGWEAISDKLSDKNKIAYGSRQLLLLGRLG